MIVRLHSSAIEAILEAIRIHDPVAEASKVFDGAKRQSAGAELSLSGVVCRMVLA
jgi:hypothetical protein